VGDPTRLKQILLNLLNNAVKFTEKGEVLVTISPVASRQGGHEIAEIGFSVQDTGIGIPPDRMDRLFLSFSQVDASTTRRYGGTGLGLAISKRLVEKMGGEIRVESEADVGSTFSFTLPMRLCALPDRPDRQERLAALRDKTVLIVDDNQTNRRIIGERLCAWGMMAQLTGSPSEAAEWIEEGRTFDVVIIDYRMPQMNGLELAQRIRRTGNEAAVPPMILFTSLTPTEASAWTEIRATGFAGVVAKPGRSAQLLNALYAAVTSEEAGHAEQTTDHLRDAVDSELSILLVDDNRINRKVGQKMLAKHGYEPDIASGGAEAISMVSCGAYDVILMDIEMPEIDGVTAARKIRRTFEGRPRPFIVALTANAQVSAREGYLASGMDDYLSKPVDETALIDCLKRGAEFRRTQQIRDDTLTARK
jgi:CheY-like chemotaxis protein